MDDRDAFRQDAFLQALPWALQNAVARKGKGVATTQAYNHRRAAIQLASKVAALAVEMVIDNPKE